MRKGGSKTIRLPVIFLSYRRDDAEADAHAIFLELVRVYGPQRVFRDVGSIQPGANWRHAVTQAVGSAGVVLALIGPDWCSSRDAGGRRRLDDPNDPVVLELTHALECGSRIIPVLVRNAEMPREEELPAAMQAVGFGELNAIRLRYDNWDVDLGALRRTIEHGAAVAASEDSAGDDAHTGPALPPQRLRVLAFLIDFVLLGALVAVAVGVGKLLWPGSTARFVLVAALLFAAATGVSLGVSVWLTAGQTLGKAIGNLTVCRKDGRPPAADARGLAWAIGRHLWGYFVIDVFGFGFLLAFVNSRRRCLHDLAFASQVTTGPFVEDAMVGSADVRLKEYAWRLREGMGDVDRRYGSSYFALKWLVRTVVAVIAVTTAVLRATGVVKVASRAADGAHSAGAAPTGSVAALPAKGAIGLWGASAAITAVGAVAIGTAVTPATNPIDPIGTWAVSAFAFQPTEGEPENQVSLEGGEMTIERATGCTSDDCPLEIAVGPDLLEGVTLEPESGRSRYVGRSIGVFPSCGGIQAPEELTERQFIAQIGSDENSLTFVIETRLTGTWAGCEPFTGRYEATAERIR